MSTDESSIFEFMSLRPIREPDPSAAAQAVIRDDEIEPIAADQTMLPPRRPGRYEIELFGQSSPSPISRDLFRLIKRESSLPALCASVERNLLRGYRGALGTPSRPFAPVLHSERINAANPATIAQLARRPYYVRDNSYFVLPGTIDDVPTPFPGMLSALREQIAMACKRIRIERSEAGGTPPLVTTSHVPATVWPALIDLVYDVDTARYTVDYAIAKRICFDAYYGLYVLRRLQPLRLEPVVAALQVLHALERLAAYLLFRYAAATTAEPAEQARIARLVQTLGTVHAVEPARGASDQDLEQRLDAAALPFRMADPESAGPLSAQPLLHPLFLHLALDWTPANDLRPVGVGDLMVVKQKFLGYQKGEIAHIETVLAGETKTAIHKRTDRMEATSSYTSSEDTQNTTDRQSTTRFELKREAETILKTDFNASLGFQLTYSSNPVVSSVTASANLSLSRTDTNRLASNFARDITEKSVTQVQRRVSQQRSQTVIAETVETNCHKFENPATNGNISGVYQWIDKVYKAEVRNFGRRLMFELVIPEPAAFFVQQRLLENAAALDLPDYPVKEAITESSSVAPPVANAQAVSREKYTELNLKYMLEDLPPPPPRIDGIAISTQSGGRVFTKSTAYNDTGMKYDKYWGCSFGPIPAGYVLDSISLTGTCDFRAKHETDARWINTLQVLLNDGQNEQIVFEQVDENLVHWEFDGSAGQTPSAAIYPSFEFLAIGTKTCDAYALSILGSASLSQSAYQAWQQSVFEALVPSRLRKTDGQGVPVEDPDVAAFRTALAEIKRPDLQRLLQGKSSEWNEQVIKRELRRQGISQVTNEFGSDSTRLNLTNMDAMGGLGLRQGYDFPTLQITPGTATSKQSTADFRSRRFPATDYRVPDVALSRRKGLQIQFIEHAFEWEQVSYVFYPYYWATPPRWVELIAREDQADPAFTSFLQAGAARVLIAVRPGFEQAVMHYLATREPWDGGTAPMIGDPLYLPVYLEIKERQDDYAGSTRVGDPWTVTVPTSLVYLESEDYPLPVEYDPTKPLD